MNTSDVTVSVLMLTYNQSAYVEQAIRSVMRQHTTFSFRLVIGDDASTDGTTDICRRWQERHPDRVVLLERAHNLGLARNFLDTYRHCTSPYIAICEGDDFWLSRHKLQRQVQWLESHPDFVLCFHRVVNYYEEQGTKSLSNGRQKRDTCLLDLARSNYISNVSAVFRRLPDDELPPWMEHVSTYDYALHMLNARHGRLHFMSLPMAVYRQHGRAIWSRTSAGKKVEISLRVRENLMEYFRDLHPEVHRILAEAHERIRQNFLSNQAHPSTPRSLPSRVLTACRAWVSRFIPLPRYR